MVVNVSVTKLAGGRVLVTVRKLQNHLPQMQQCDSENTVLELLWRLGIPEDALEFYFSQLFPRLQSMETLVFPSVNIPARELTMSALACSRQRTTKIHLAEIGL
jgi:hypothetical protein